MNTDIDIGDVVSVWFSASYGGGYETQGVVTRIFQTRNGETYYEVELHNVVDFVGKIHEKFFLETNDVEKVEE